jgi:hypothetical protein
MKMVGKASMTVLTIAMLNALAACSGAGMPLSVDGTSSDVPATRDTVQILPATALLASGAQLLFDTGFGGLSVVWQVLESQGGTIDATGLYTAPAEPGTYHVKATAAANPAMNAVATVTVTAIPGGSCAAEPLRTTGKTYYVCDCQAGAAAGCVAGSDSNAGTSPGAPLQTIGKANTVFGTMAAGSTIAFCRGGSFAAGSTSVKWSKTCSSGTGTCDLRDYAPSWGQGAGNPRPIITFTGGAGTSPFNLTGGAFFLRILNLDLRSTAAAWGIWATNTRDVDVCGVSLQGFDLGLHIQGDKPATNPARITLRQSQIYGGSQGVLGDADGLAIDSNYFENAGADNARDHSIYLTDMGYCAGSPTTCATPHGSRITNNHFKYTRGCYSSIITKNGTSVDHLYENNLIETTDPSFGTSGCTGLAVGCGYDQWPWVTASTAPTCFHENAVVRRNRVVNVGSIGIEVTSCHDCVVESNVVGPMGSGGQAIQLSAKRNSPLDYSNANVTIRNNVIYNDSHTANAGAIAYQSETPSGAGNVVTSNTIYKTGSNSWSCFGLGTNAAIFSAVDYNHCYASGGNPSWGTVPAGSDAHSLKGNVDPLFTDVVGLDFTLRAGSPLIGAADPSRASPVAMGAAQWSATDAGKQRGTPPDIGAHQR